MRAFNEPVRNFVCWAHHVTKGHVCRARQGRPHLHRRCQPYPVAKREASLIPKTAKPPLVSMPTPFIQTARLRKRTRRSKAELAIWSGSTPAQKLDPKVVKPSKWANRLKFSGKGWNAFKEEISHSGGNIQPIKVRCVIPDNTSSGASGGEGAIPYSTPSPLYEIVLLASRCNPRLC